MNELTNRDLQTDDFCPFAWLQNLGLATVTFAFLRQQNTLGSAYHTKFCVQVAALSFINAKRSFLLLTWNYMAALFSHFHPYISSHLFMSSLLNGSHLHIPHFLSLSYKSQLSSEWQGLLLPLKWLFFRNTVYPNSMLRALL